MSMQIGIQWKRNFPNETTCKAHVQNQKQEYKDNLEFKFDQNLELL